MTAAAGRVGQWTGRRLVAVVAGVVGVGWAVTALWIVPAVIASAYAGESLPVLNRLIGGQSVHPVSHYVDAWRRLALVVTGFGIAVGVMLAALVLNAREIPRQLRAASAGLPFAGAAGAVVFAVWIGVLAGLGEVVNALAQQRVRFLATGDVASAELVWMIPVAAAVALSLVGLVLALLDRIPRSNGLVLGTAPAVLSGLAVYSLLRALAIGVSKPAALILALGVAVAMTRGLAGSPQAGRRLVRRTVPWLVSALVVWAVGVPFWRDWRAGRLEAALPAAPADAPSVVVVVLDAVRAASLSTYGHTRETSPTLTQLAGSGLLFERAYATSPWSLPSHAAMLTGRYPHELTTDFDRPLDDVHPSIAEVLAAHGYATGTFTANLFYGSAAFGLDRGFTWYDDRPPTVANTIIHSWWLSRLVAERVRYRAGEFQTMVRRDAGHVNRSFARWLRRQGDRPVLAVLNYFDAHRPYIPPPPFDRVFSDGPVRGWLAPLDEPVTPRLQQELLTAYDACVRYVDMELGALVELLRAEGRLDNTLLIVTSDHGEQFAEERPNLTGHALSLFPSALHVPLVVHFPKRVSHPARAATAVSIRDIPATILDAVGLSDPRFPGHSLLRHVAAEHVPPAEPVLAAAQPHVWAAEALDWPAARGHQFAIIDGDMQYILDGTGAEHLYDLTADPWAQLNLAASQQGEAALARLRLVLDSMVPPREDGRRTAVRAGLPY